MTKPSAAARAQVDTRFSTGTLNVNSGVDGYDEHQPDRQRQRGLAGKNIAASGRTDGNAGVIFKPALRMTALSAKVNGRIVQLSGNRNYLPLSPYSRYEVELQNGKNSLDSYDIVTGRESQLTLYPGNVAVIGGSEADGDGSGRIRAEDGTLLANARINNHIGRTRTDENGEFVMDVDKKYPTIDFSYGKTRAARRWS